MGSGFSAYLARGGHVIAASNTWEKVLKSRLVSLVRTIVLLTVRVRNDFCSAAAKEAAAIAAAVT